MVCKSNGPHWCCFHKQKIHLCLCVCTSSVPLPPTLSADRRLTELEGLRLSWESVSGGNWKSAGRVVFLLLALRADLLLVVAACQGKADNVRFSSGRDLGQRLKSLQTVISLFSRRFYLHLILCPISLNWISRAKTVVASYVLLRCCTS